MNSFQRIFLVEVEPDLRQRTAEVLVEAGHQVAMGEDGESAWAALQQSKYDLLITDQFMPKVSGLELLKQVHAARMNLPAILATGFIPLREFAQHPWLQGVRLISKPYSSKKLLVTVKAALATTVRENLGVSATSASLARR